MPTRKDDDDDAALLAAVAGELRSSGIAFSDGPASNVDELDPAPIIAQARKTLGDAAADALAACIDEVRVPGFAFAEVDGCFFVRASHGSDRRLLWTGKGWAAPANDLSVLRAFVAGHPRGGLAQLVAAFALSVLGARVYTGEDELASARSHVAAEPRCAGHRDRARELVLPSSSNGRARFVADLDRALVRIEIDGGRLDVVEIFPRGWSVVTP